LVVGVATAWKQLGPESSAQKILLGVFHLSWSLG